MNDNRPRLHIDIETYSSVDIGKAGAYKYVQSPDFEILMTAFAFDDRPIKIFDHAEGEEFSPNFLSALTDPEVVKCAHNANFERNSFRAIGIDIPVEQWECTAVKSLYCGFPSALADVSRILALGDKEKLKIGKELIKYFSIPQKPTSRNGKRFRNFPEHDPERWELFKEYCIRDVEAEREIDHILSVYEFPEFERINYILDQKINDKGILIDIGMASNAKAIDDLNTEVLGNYLKDITGLENPNSPLQLRKWLGEAMQKDIKSLAKETLEDLISEAEAGHWIDSVNEGNERNPVFVDHKIEIKNPEKVREVLELRKKSSKTSTKKYVSMLTCAGFDNRVRGLFQFYGANRTGRWAGRLVQLQNLPQNKIKDLEKARKLVLDNDYEMMDMVYDNVADTLSQLVRTAFIAPEGKTFAVADFSAIEARVIAWLADEKWRLDVFATHGKIYEASASMMFGVPLDQITKDSEYRTKGKIAELALGYQGALGAMRNMGGEKMGLTEGEMMKIVKIWRLKNPKIVSMWDAVNEAAIECIERESTVVLKQFKNLEFSCDGEVMTIKLPSGRKLFYQNPIISTNRFGSKAVKYKGLDQLTKKWWWIDSYGGKFVENIIQAIARDLLAYSMQKLDEADFDLVMHVHDEAVAEILKFEAESRLEEMCDIMGAEVPWAPGLPLRADGYITEFYKKD